MERSQVCLYLERGDPHGMIDLLTTYGFYVVHVREYTTAVVVYYAVDVLRLPRLTDIVLPAFQRGEITRWEFGREAIYA